MPRLIVSLATIVVAGVALAEEKPVALKAAPGLDKVEANCAACHSLNYIQMNSPFLTAEKWDGEVTKMISVMGARISESDAREIADYLKQNYGERSAEN
ncbi:MAG: cytochrome c [Methylocystis sp.]|uniref:c-type cytochrome n=1 Tax=Methylocystis sp. TaxID=1911079 RepID=UPI003963892C